MDVIYGVTDAMDDQPFYITAICIGIPIFIVVGAVLLRYFGTETIIDDESSEESSEESSDEWEPGSSSLELISIRERVVRKFPDMVDVFDASCALPDVLGQSNVHLVKIDDNHQSYENTFGDYLRRITAANAKHPNRTIYTIVFDDVPREIVIYIGESTEGMKSVTRRANEMMLNEYSEVASIAIWFMRYKNMTSTEAYAEVLCLNTDNDTDFDPYEAMCGENLEPIAKAMNQELKEIYNRI